VFPTSVRGRGSASEAAVDWLANFAIIEVFPVWNFSIGPLLGARVLCRPLSDRGLCRRAGCLIPRMNAPCGIRPARTPRHGVLCATLPMM
jgi:hypothetical protein